MRTGRTAPPADAEAGLREADMFLAAGYPTMALGAVARAIAAAAFSDYQAGYYELAEPLRLEYAKAAVAAQLARSREDFERSTLLIPGPGPALTPWSKFELELFASTYVAQSQWFLNHTTIILKSLDTSESMTRVHAAYRNAAAVGLNLRFIDGLVGLKTPVRDWAVSSENLAEISAARYTQATDPTRINQGGPVLKALTHLMGRAVAEARPALVLGAFLAFVEQEDTLDAQYLESRGYGYSPASTWPGALEQFEQFRAENPRVHAYTAVDRLQQSFTLVETASENAAGRYASQGQMKFISESLQVELDVLELAVMELGPEPIHWNRIAAAAVAGVLVALVMRGARRRSGAWAAWVARGDG